MLNPRRLLLALLVVAAAVASGSQSAVAQSNPQALERGFAVKLDAGATTQEMQKQERLFVMEVTFKPMRLLWVDVTDPKTGRQSRNLVWYIVYKAVNRKLEQRQGAEETKPVNDEDPVPPPVFAPSFTLVGTDGGEREIYKDVILPEALAVIAKREFRGGSTVKPKHSIQLASSPFPEAVPVDEGDKNAIYGVAVFQDVDPETDFFEVYMSGFSNGYVKKDGLTYRKTIHQKYKRPGDRFLQDEVEFNLDGAPQWIYWPDDAADDKQPAKKQPAEKKPAQKQPAKKQ